MGLFSRKKESVSPFLFPAGSRRMLRNTDALYNSAFWACVIRLASLYASTPWNVYRKDAKGNIVGGSAPIAELLKEQNRLQTSYDFKFMMGLNFELHGTAMAYIRRTSKGTPAMIVPVPTGSMIASYDENGDRWYTYAPAGLKFADSDMLVINKTPSGFDTVLSPLAYAANDLDLEKKCREMQEDYFNGSSIIGNIIKVPSTLTDEQKDMVKARFDSAGEGGFRNFVIDNRIEVTPLQASNLDVSKLVEHMKMSVADVCRRFVVPPFIANDMAGAYNNLAEQMTQFMVLSLNPRLRAWEEALNRALCGKDEYIEFDRESLMQGTPAQKAEYYSKLIMNGQCTPNEARKAQGKPSVGPEGDKLYMQTNMGTVELISQGAYGASNGADAWNTEKRAQTASVKERYSHMTKAERKAFDRIFVEDATSQAKSARRQLESALRKQTKAEIQYAKEALSTKNTEVALTDFTAYLDQCADEFRGTYEEIYSKVMAKLAPVIKKQTGQNAEISAESMKAFVESYVSGLMGRHEGFIRKMVSKYARMEDPEALEAEMEHLVEDYPTSESNEEVNRSSNAFTVFAFECLGVMYYHVVAGADSCSFCSNLDGMGCEAHGYILQKGDEREDGEGNIRRIDKNYRHPPFHGGCNCHVAPW